MDNMEDLKNACDAAMLKQKRKFTQPQRKYNNLLTPEVEHLRKLKVAAKWKYIKAKKKGSCDEQRHLALQTKKALQLAIRKTKGTSYWNQQVINVTENLKKTTIHDNVKVIDRNDILRKTSGGISNSVRTASISNDQTSDTNHFKYYHNKGFTANRNINTPPASIP